MRYADMNFKIHNLFKVNTILLTHTMPCRQIMNWFLCVAVAGVLFMGCDRYDAHDALAKGDRSALRAALEHGVDVNQINQEGLSLLHVAVAKPDAEATRILLEHGAKWDIPNRAGQTVLASALLGGLGPDPIKATIAAESKGPDDPSVQVLRTIMRAVRKESMVVVDMKGTLSIALDYRGMGAGGIQLISHLIFITPDGKKYEINLSRWETDYTDVKKSGEGSGWIVVVRPGGQYRIAGAEKDGKIDATLLALEAPPKGEDAMAVPLRNWLPSTWKLMEEHTWLGKLSAK